MRETLEKVRRTIATHRGLTAAAVLALLVIAGSVVAVVGNNDSGIAESKSQSLLKQPFAAPPVPARGGAATAGSGVAFTVGGRDAAAPTAAASGVGGAGVLPQLAKGGPAASLPNAGPKIVKTAELRVKVAKGRFDRAFDDAASVAEANGGYVAASSRSTDDNKIASGQLEIRVKADRFDAARKSLSGLGTVESDAIHGEDVTAQLVDYDARLRSLQAQENTLRTLLSQAKSIGEILPVQQQLFDVRQQIEQLQAQRQQLDDNASLATIRVTMFEPGAAAKVEPQPRTGLSRSAERAWHGARDVVGGMLVVLGYASPLVLIGLLAWGGYRLRRRPAAEPEVS